MRCLPSRRSAIVLEACYYSISSLIAGSIPEVRKGKYYNTSMSFGPDGALLGVFRKVCS